MPAMAPMTAIELSAAQRLWQQGWYRPAAPVPSVNCSARAVNAMIDLIVLHCISLPPGAYGGDEVERLFTNRLDWDAHPYFGSIRGLRVSAHFYIRRDGKLRQFVSTEACAWHAGASCYRGRSNCNDDSIGIELEGLVGATFQPAQYQTLGRLCSALVQRYPIAHIAGHQHIAPGRKQDPGSAFDWQCLQQALGLGNDHFPH